MKTQITIRYLLSITVSLLVLCANAEAGLYFFDDFSDGDPKDGSPVNWVPSWGVDATGYTLTPEGLKVAGAGAADRDGTPYIYRDVSVRTQIKRTSNYSSNEWVSGLVVRWNDGGPGGYWIEVRPPNRFWLGHRDRYVLRSANLPFNVDERELIIRVDIIGDQIKCWCWPADELMPDEPQLTLVEDVVPDGTFGLYAGTQGGQAVYRWVEAVSVEAPSVDFNGDGKVDISDLLRLIESWGQDDPICDVAPPPFCDGIVDVLDLELLMGYWGQPVDDPTLIAHWALDETEGSIAYDSAGSNDAFVIGGPVWLPSGGQVDGALQLDGVDDCVITDSIRNPAEGALSVFVWVRVSVPGQVVLSQIGRENWLCTDSSEGNLMTELKSAGRDGCSLISETAITDGNWHRIGLVWDGSNRTLYVDDVVVAEDTQDSLTGSDSGLYIGSGKGMESGNYWSGLIDDVRIYNRAIRP
jgi:hypothetical protein